MADEHLGSSLDHRCRGNRWCSRSRRVLGVAQAVQAEPALGKGGARAPGSWRVGSPGLRLWADGLGGGSFGRCKTSIIARGLSVYMAGAPFFFYRALCSSHITDFYTMV